MKYCETVYTIVGALQYGRVWRKLLKIFDFHFTINRTASPFTYRQTFTACSIADTIVHRHCPYESTFNSYGGFIDANG